MARKISVIMSVYNAERFLRQAIESILRQTFADFEFLILDDCSNDTSPAIIRSYNDPRIRIIVNETNLGLTASLNKGLSLASGEYIARMDADDVSLPKRFEKQVEFLDAHPEIGVLGTAIQNINAQGVPSTIRRFAAEPALLRWKMCFRNPFAHPGVMMRRNVVIEAGGYNSALSCAQDHDLWGRLSFVTGFSNLSEVLLYRRRHATNISKAHLNEQSRNGVKVSQQVMSGILNTEICEGLAARCVRYQRCQTKDELKQTVALIHRLYQVMIAQATLSITDKRLIRRDAAQRILALARQHILSVKGAWKIVGDALRFDPLAGFRWGITAGLNAAQRLFTKLN